jgi:lipopolysaccharide/colanic/teichoic acid biosynthesis glycosyltransferase
MEETGSFLPLRSSASSGNESGTVVPPGALPAASDALRRLRLKRAVDLTVATILLITLAPVLAAIALAIKLDTGGPVIFRHLRVGSRLRRMNGETWWEATTFYLFKFRSMVVDADERRHRQHIQAFVSGRLTPNEGSRAVFKLADDPRVTRVGGFLRRTSLDELPQLLNVLLGQMSLVGPRPLPVYEVELHGREERGRLAAVPGVTGLSQVRGRANLSHDRMMELDLQYVRKQSLRLDVKILAMTIPAVFGGRGAA